MIKKIEYSIYIIWIAATYKGILREKHVQTDNKLLVIADNEFAICMNLLQGNVAFFIRGYEDRCGYENMLIRGYEDHASNVMGIWLAHVPTLKTG